MVTTFKFIAGALCLDFVNTVGGRTGLEPLNDKFAGPADLTRWCQAAALPAPGRISPALFRRAIAFREALYRICSAIGRNRSPSAEDLQTFNRELALARGSERLRFTRRGFEFEPGSELLAPIVRSAAELLTSDRLHRVRECGGDECGWMFLDTSRNGSRRWCQMEVCGNRAKARSFRTRRAAT